MFRFKVKASSGEIVEGEVRAPSVAETMIEVRWLIGPDVVFLQVGRVPG